MRETLEHNRPFAGQGKPQDDAMPEMTPDRGPQLDKHKTIEIREIRPKRLLSEVSLSRAAEIVLQYDFSAVSRGVRGFQSFCLEIPDLTAVGVSEGEAIEKAKEGAIIYIAAMIEIGKPLPSPLPKSAE